MTPTLCFIHGMNSSHNSFAYLAKELGTKSSINYISHQALAASIEQVAKQLPRDKPLILIGHSLGGVIALMIAHMNTHSIKKVVTISSPLGGSKAAVYARWIAQELHVLRDITPYSPIIQSIKSKPAPCDVLSIISTGGGLSMSNEPNDSVVTVASQRALAYGEKIEVRANHFEVLLHDRTIEEVRKFVVTNG